MGEHGVPKTTLCSAMGIRGLPLQPQGLQECAWDTRLPRNPSFLVKDWAMS